MPGTASGCRTDPPAGALCGKLHMTRRYKSDRLRQLKNQLGAAPPKRLTDDAANDEALALKLLCGIIDRDRKQRPVRRYLRPNSVPEADARTALMRRLRSKRLSWYIREALIGLFDPDPMRSERKITFQYRRRGKRSKLDTEIIIGQSVHDEINRGTKPESAVQSAMDKYGLSRRTVFTMLETYRSFAGPSN